MRSLRYIQLVAALLLATANLSAQATIVGQPCGPSNSSMSFLGAPTPGTPFEFGVAGPSNSPTVLFVGFPSNPLPLGNTGCALHLDLPLSAAIILTTDSAGSVTLTGDIPLAQPPGSQIAFQFAFLHNGPYFGISFSDALHVTFTAP